MSGNAQDVNNVDLVFAPSTGIVYVEYGHGKPTTRKFITHLQPPKDDSYSDDTSEDEQLKEQTNFTEFSLSDRSFTFCNLQDIQKLE